MGVAITSLAVEMALGGSYRLEVDTDNPVGWWRFSERSGTSARDSSGNARHGTITGGVTKGVESTNPESGGAFTYDGTSGYVTMGDVAAFEFTGAFTAEFWMKAASAPGTTRRILGKEGDGTNRGWRVDVLTTGRVQFYARNGADSGTAFSFDNGSNLCNDAWHHVVCTFDGTTDANGVKIYVDGAVAAQATSASATITASATQPFVVAATGPFASFFPGTLDEVALYSDDLSSARVTAHYQAAAWTAVTGDVLLDPVLKFRIGINGNGPADRIANVGLCSFYLNNDRTNSAGLQGYYAPNHANARAGFTFGTLTRVSFVYSGTTYRRFIGKIEHIDPEPGQYISGRTRVQVADLMSDIIETDLRNVTLQTSTTEDSLLRTLLEALPVTAQPLGYDLDTGLDTVPYAFDDLGQGMEAVRPASQLLISTLGFGSINSHGIWTYENRQARQTSASSYTFDDDVLTGLVVPSSLDGVYNHIRIVTHPRRIDAAATTVLYSLFTNTAKEADATDISRTSIAAGATLESWGDYFNPSNIKQKIGGTAQVSPVATTDYKANSAADGTGTNKTADITVVAEFFATTVKFTITNNDAALVFITKLQCRGKGLYSEATETVESTSSQPYGDRPVNIDMPYQGSSTTAKDLADYLLEQFESPSNHAHSLTFDPQRSNAMMLAALSASIGDRITVTETMTGLTMVDVFIHSIDIEVRSGARLSCVFGLSPSIFASEFWILEDADSELGTNTFLAFG